MFGRKRKDKRNKASERSEEYRDFSENTDYARSFEAQERERAAAQKKMEEQQARKLRTKTKRRIIALAVVCCVLFGFMINYFITYALDNEVSLFGNDYNKRDDLQLEQVVRGSIYSRDNDVLAQTITNDDGTAYRYYPYGEAFSHVVGYTENGGGGIERSEKYYLLHSNIPLTEKFEYDGMDQRYPGNDVYTTLSPTLQQAAYDALGDYQGAVVVSNPTTGEILAMVSKPDFDPNSISDTWEYYTEEDEDATLLNRATMGLYPPGSTFKIIDTIDFLTEDPDAVTSYSYDCTGEFTKDNETIHCYQDDVHGTVDLEESFAKSCNCSFANIGFMLTKSRLRNLCGSLLFNEEIPFDLPTEESSISIPDDISTKEMIQVSIGQGTTEMTPLHLNMITAAVANGGTLLQPYVIDHVQDADGNILQQNGTKSIGRVMDETVAANIRQFMTTTVTSGTAILLSNSNYTAAGKTGSAEYDEENNSHAWFTGFAPAENPEICVTVIIEGAESGGEYAVPVARKVLNAYFGVS